MTLKGELNPEMKLCELLALSHCIHFQQDRQSLWSPAGLLCI